jgi:hypothetical protein
MPTGSRYKKKIIELQKEQEEKDNRKRLALARIKEEKQKTGKDKKMQRRWWREILRRR